MSDTLKKHGLVSSHVEPVDSPEEENLWTRQPCLTLNVAQDLAVFMIIEGGRVKIYSGLKGTDEDVQSKAGRKILAVPVRDIVGAVDQARRSQLASAWESLRTDPSYDAEPQSCEEQRDEQPEILDEIAKAWTSDRLAKEILRLAPDVDWPQLSELILTAEDFDFTSEQSAKLALRLLELATQHRDSNDQQDAAPVFSAIRTGASMLRPNEASRLLALLRPGHSIETGLVALKMLGRIFEAQPPEKPDQHPDLAGEVQEIAESFLNRYAIVVSPQNAAMAQLAVCTLAAMASTETLRIVQDVRRIGISWFTQQTARELHELRSSWAARSAPVAPEVLELLDRAISEFQTN